MNPDYPAPCGTLYPLFEHMSREHRLTLWETELVEICHVVDQMRADWRKRPESRLRIPIPAGFDPLESSSVSAALHGVSRRTIYKWREIVAARMPSVPALVENACPPGPDEHTRPIP